MICLPAEDNLCPPPHSLLLLHHAHESLLTYLSQSLVTQPWSHPLPMGFATCWTWGNSDPLCQHNTKEFWNPFVTRILNSFVNLLIKPKRQVALYWWTPEDPSKGYLILDHQYPARLLLLATDLHWKIGRFLEGQASGVYQCHLWREKKGSGLVFANQLILSELSYDLDRKLELLWGLKMPQVLVDTTVHYPRLQWGSYRLCWGGFFTYKW